MTKPTNNGPTLSVGEPCVWYRNGLKDAPCAAQVMEVEAHGQLALVARPPHEGAHRTVMGVHHVDSPFLVKHPSVAEQHGSWDFVGSHALMRTIAGLMAEKGTDSGKASAAKPQPAKTK
jgi:hypothetical protein